MKVSSNLQFDTHSTLSDPSNYTADRHIHKPVCLFIIINELFFMFEIFGAHVLFSSQIKKNNNNI